MEKLPKRCGINLHAQHHRDIVETRPDVAWFEFVPEDYPGTGGEAHYYLQSIASDYPLAMHCQGLSIASAESPDPQYLEHVGALLERYQPLLVSAPLAWNRWQGVYLEELLPIPYTREALDQLTFNIKTVQNLLGRRLLLENPANYLEVTEHEFSEAEFLQALIRNTGCGLVLDINNLYVSSLNRSQDPFRQLTEYPLAAIQEIQLSGHGYMALNDETMLLTGDVSSAPKKPVMQLLREALNLLPQPLPTLVEWRSQPPELDRLLDEMREIDSLLQLAAISQEGMSS